MSAASSLSLFSLVMAVSFLWAHSALADTVTKTIGTASRDYSTITLWEADLDDTGIYTSGDDAVGEVYNDSVFDEAVTINGGGTVGLASVKLTVPVGERHDGTAGTGARIVQSAYRQIIVSTGPSKTIEYLEIDFGGFGSNDNLLTITAGTASTAHIANQLIVHHGLYAGDKAASVVLVRLSSISGTSSSLLNSIVYDLERGNALGGGAIGVNATNVAASTFNILNNTVHNIRITNASKTTDVFGINVYGQVTTKNNIVTDTATAGSGTALDFNGSHLISATNASSDSTAPSPIAAEPVVSSAEFVSTVVGSEDLHLKAGAESIDAGTDLGTIPTGVNFDIDNRDRDALGDTWDIGADEFVAAGPSMKIKGGNLRFKGNMTIK